MMTPNTPRGFNRKKSVFLPTRGGGGGLGGRLFTFFLLLQNPSLIPSNQLGALLRCSSTPPWSSWTKEKQLLITCGGEGGGCM